MTAAYRRVDAPAGGAIAAPLRAILAVQRPDGAIPWFDGGPWDAWNHGECVMALAAAGETAAPRAGLDLLATRQQRDGSWLSECGNALPMADHVRIAREKAPEAKDTNFTAYVATVVLHQHRLGVRRTLDRWPMVRAAIDHVVAHQHPQGDISWCAEAHGTTIDDSLVAANASIFSSLGHAILLAAMVGEPRPDWAAARDRLGDCLRHRPDRFDRAETSRDGFAMDWYYLALAGVLPAADGRSRLREGWARFVDAGLGCRCVADQPWATVAETCELAMAAARVGMAAEARQLVAWAGRHRDEHGALWMAWQHAEAIFRPAEQPSWTQAAYILACDALDDGSAAAGLLLGR